MNTIYKTIANCKCTELNRTKLSTLNIVRDWMNNEIKRCVQLFAKGYTFRKVYNSFDKNVNSTYKAKITSSAAFYFKHYYRGHRRFNAKLYNMSGCNKSWVPSKCIEFFEIKKDYSKVHQLKVVIKLPFEIKGKTSIALSAEVPRKYWKRSKLYPVYDKGFHLCIFREYVEINLISKIEPTKIEGNYIKSIYVSPYGGLHTASMRDIRQLHEVHKVKLKEYYECYYGVSKESQKTLDLLKDIRDFQHKEDLYKNLKQLEIKCKTRVNKFFETLDSQQSDDKIYHKIVVAKVVDGNSKITNFIQDTCNLQIKKNCDLRGIEYVEECFTRDDLECSAKWTMRKAERENLKEQHKVGNKFRAAAILKKHFVGLFDKDSNPIKIGVITNKKSEKFSENSYVEIAQQDTDVSQTNEIVFI